MPRLQTSSIGSGNPGSIDIFAEGVTVKGGSKIYSETRQKIKTEEQDFARYQYPGLILVEGLHDLIVNDSTISTNTFDTADAGSIVLMSKQNITTNNAKVTSNTEGDGNAGIIALGDSDSIVSIIASPESEANGLISSSNIELQSSTVSSKTSSEGKGGLMAFFANNIVLGETNITSESTGNLQERNGDAGFIFIYADNLSFFNGSQITTEAKKSGGGQVELKIGEQLYLPQSTKITTSVEKGEKNGGDIFIENKLFTVLNKGEIHADAHRGNGGNIDITTTGYFVSDQSLVTASSQFGLDGYIQIDILGSLNSEALENLPSELTNTDLEFKPSCLNQDTSSFRLIPRSGIATRAHDWQSAH